jgi:cystathionine beta-lyase/cystathionine gamma-synthase
LNEKERLSLGITDNLIRLSIGLETVADLKKDIATALK